MNAKVSSSLTLLLSVAILCGAVGAQTILQDTELKGDAPQGYGKTVVRNRNVIVDIALLRSEKSTIISVPLFDDSTIRITRDELRRVDRDLVIWKGAIADQPSSNAVFVIKGNTVAADIVTADNRMFQIRYIGNRVHSLRQIDQSQFRSEATPLKPVPRQKEGGNLPAADTCSTDGPDTIDEMVVYTPAARTSAGGTDAMIATIYLAVEETNQSYFNSDIDQRLRLVHVEEVSYTESGDVYTDLPRLQDGNDGFMDNVPTLRDTYGADTVSLIVQTADYCGLGYFMATVNNSFENSAYSVVDYECSTGYYSFGHELGHNMGADHDTANSSGAGAYTYDHGFIHPSAVAAESWRTVMSYQTAPTSTRVQYWSNPNINYPVMSVAMGTAATEDNHHVLNNTALTVANFRCSSPGTANVWMKDTWSDTGAEPDASGDPMWESPYIWVRNMQDTLMTHQHEHQNPIFGSTNYLYVKLHNGSGATHSGQLDLRFARAATGLSWPAEWTAVSGTPVAVSIPAHSTRIVEVAWSNVPENPDHDQHYCMVAMWTADAADPMAVALGADIGADTKNNNNVAWRNMNVVNMAPDASADESFDMRNVSRSKAIVGLTIKSARDSRLVSFFEYGQITVSFDDRLFELVKRGFKEQAGVKLEGNKFIVSGPKGVTFGNIVVPGAFAGKVRLTFHLNKDAPKRRYKVVASQTQVGAKVRGVGGVSAEIYAYERY